MAGLGAHKDKSAHDRFTFTQLTEPDIDAMCDGDWVAKKLVELPVRDTFRVWRTWADKAAKANAFEEAEKRHGVRRKLAKAMLLARRYGGSAILIGADTADPAQPLRAEAVGRGGLKYLTVLTHRDITPGDEDKDPESPTYGEPLFYTLNEGDSRGHIRIHASRVIRIVGAERLDFMGGHGWGYSVLQAPFDAVKNAAVAAAASASLVHEAKVDIVNVKNLSATLQTDAGTAALTKRFTLANMMKSINNMLLLDENEIYNRSQTSFAGVPDLLSRFMNIAAAAADIPVSRFLAESSASGLRDGGSTDLRHYYDHLASERERVLAPILDRLDAILWRDATGRNAGKGTVYVWGELWQPTDREKADTAKVVADVVKTYVDAGLLDEEALAVGASNSLIESGLLPGLEQAFADRGISGDPDLEDGPDDDDTAVPSTPSPARDARPRRSGRFAARAVASGGRSWSGSTAPAY